jgi:hypothetical protein
MLAALLFPFFFKIPLFLPLGESRSIELATPINATTFLFGDYFFDSSFAARGCS